MYEESSDKGRAELLQVAVKNGVPLRGMMPQNLLSSQSPLLLGCNLRVASNLFPLLLWSSHTETCFTN